MFTMSSELLAFLLAFNTTTQYNYSGSTLRLNFIQLVELPCSRLSILMTVSKRPITLKTKMHMGKMVQTVYRFEHESSLNLLYGEDTAQ